MPNPSDRRPIQVFLDTRRFIQLEQPQEFGGGAKDFFENSDKEFAEHKSRIKAKVEGVAHALKRSGQPGGFVKVQQRDQALAKTHRPLGHLFTLPNSFALVGAEGIGELLFQTTPDALARLANIIEAKAELTPRTVRNQKTGKDERRVSGFRSELGGVSDVQLYAAVDKVKFSAEEAVRWMIQPNVIGGYIVELFRPDRRVSSKAIDQLVTLFRQGLERLGGGLLIRPFLPSVPTSQFGEPTLALSVHLTADGRRFIDLPFLTDGRAAEMSET